jgi:hypothetical protein
VPMSAVIPCSKFVLLYAGRTWNLEVLIITSLSSFLSSPKITGTKVKAQRRRTKVSSGSCGH